MSGRPSSPAARAARRTGRRPCAPPAWTRRPLRGPSARSAAGRRRRALIGRAEGERPADADVAAADHRHSRPQCARDRWRTGDATPRSASPASTSTSRSGSASSVDDGVERGRIDGVHGGLNVRELGGPVAFDRADRLRSRGCARRRAAVDARRSRCTDACSALNPSNPSLAASRTTVAAPAPAAEARSATVPNPTSWGRSRTTSATRRSAAVSWLARLARPAPRPPCPAPGGQ